MWFNDFSLWFTVFSCPFLVLVFMICYVFSYCLFSEMMAAENSSEPAQGNFFSSIICFQFWFGYASKQSSFWFGNAMKMIIFGLDMHLKNGIFGLEMLDFAYFRLDF